MIKREHDFAALSRSATNISLDPQLVAEARSLRISISQEHARRWKQENAEALASSNIYVDQHGLPLARHRQF